MMKLVIIESPYAGDIERNIRYGRACMADCLKRGEAPYASHLLYTQDGVLKDEITEERKLGIEAGFAWRKVADLTVVYTDLGFTQGMRLGIKDSEDIGIPVEYRTLPNWDLEEKIKSISMGCKVEEYKRPICSQSNTKKV